MRTDLSDALSKKVYVMLSLKYFSNSFAETFGIVVPVRWGVYFSKRYRSDLREQA